MTVIPTFRMFVVGSALLAFVIPASVIAKPRFGRVTGQVVDARYRHPIAEAVISLNDVDRQDTTDSAGIFHLDSLPVGVWEVVVEANGYLAEVLPSVSVLSGVNEDLLIEMSVDDKIHVLDRMTVRASLLSHKGTEQFTSVQKMSRDEVLKAPGAIQDPNRMLQTLPSAIAGNDESNEFLVRGGGADENVFVIDGIEMRNLSHWGTQYGSGGIISKLHTDFIRDIEFYAGGVPANFAPKLSSVTNIRFREGSMTDRRYQFDLNMAGFGAFIEGPIVRGKSSYMLNARVSFLDLLDPFLDLTGLPKYQSGQLKLAWDINDRNTIIANTLVGHESVEYPFDDDDGGYDQSATHVVGGVRWTFRGDRLLNELLASAVYHTNDEWETLPDADSVTRITAWEIASANSRIQLKDDLKLFFREKDVLTTGLVVEGEEYGNRIANDEYFILADTAQDSSYLFSVRHPGEDVFIIDSIDRYIMDTTTIGYRIGVHAAYTMFLGPVKLNAGLREDYFTLPRKHAVSPRGGVALLLEPAGTFSLSGGLYYQMPSYILILPDSLNLWDLELQRSWQAVLGYEKALSENTMVGVEGYYKRYDREPLYSLISYYDTTVDGRARSYGVLSIDVDRKHYSKKEAYGLEVYLHKRKVDRFYYQFSYSLFSVKRQFRQGEWYDDDYNLRNNGTVILGSNINKHHRLSLRLDLSEGRPRTPISMEYSDRYKLTVYDITNGWNIERREMRTKLSLRYDLTLYARWGNFSLYLELQNLLNQQDVMFEYYNRGEKFPEGEVTKMMSPGIIPIGGITVDF